MTDVRNIESDGDLRQLVRELADEPMADGQRLLSLYVNLDPRVYGMPSARSTSLSDTIGEAIRTAPDSRWLRMLQELGSELEAVDPTADGAQGLLVLCREDGE